MSWLGTIARELVGLVVDDVAFASAIVGWLAVVWLLKATVLPPTPWTALLLFAGLGLILVESVVRRAGAAR